MKEILIKIVGHDDHLSTLQMVTRAILVFILCLLYLRLAGRRAFGIGMPLDNVIAILLGSLLSRCIVGASPFIPTIIAALAIVVLYRLFAVLSVYSKLFGKIVKGKEVLVFSDGHLRKKNMNRCMVTEHDLVEELRINSLDSFEKVETIYVERNGKISVIKKEKG